MALSAGEGGHPVDGMSEPSRTKTRTARGNGLYRKPAGSQGSAGSVKGRSDVLPERGPPQVGGYPDRVRS
jgi:hypothetical protein